MNGYILLPLLPIVLMMNRLMRSIEPGAARDSIVGDGADVTVLQKRKRQPMKKKPTRWSALEWKKQLHIDPDEF
jgi:hypothetical protein